MGNRIVKKVDRKMFTIFHVSTCIVLLVSGLINMILLAKENKYIKNLSYNIWKKLLIAKFILTLALTPILEKIIPSSLINNNFPVDANASSNNANAYFKIRLSIVLGLFLISPFLRFFREYNLKPLKGNENPAGVVKVNQE